MLKWKLKQIMVEKGLWTGQELLELLETRAGIIVSHTAVMQLIKNDPKAIRWQTLDALCTALECSPWELIEYSPSVAKREAAYKAVGEREGAIRPYARKNKGQEKPKKTLYPEESF
ncbi:MAG: helix-turn-helix transcriptional regulator [Firmicutes bacterium]|nr:helix-turn-helix transcriptional regulator [Bacillota bacterium]